MTNAEPMWCVTTVNNDLSDDSDECTIDRSDSLESCPCIEPSQIGSLPVVPERPDNLDDHIREKEREREGKPFTPTWLNKSHRSSAYRNK